MIKLGHMCAAVLAGASLLLAASACSPAGDGPAAEGKPGPKRAAPSAPQSPPGSAGAPADGTAEAVAAYRAMWDDAVAVARVPDENDPRLDDHAQNGGLGLLRYMMRETKKQGLVAKGQVHLAPIVRSAGASKVVIQDCLDGSRWLQYRTDGTLKNNVPGGHHKTDATVVEQDGRWMVDSLYLHEVGTCGA